LGVGGVEFGDSVGLFECEILLEVDVDDLFDLVVVEVFDFVQLSFLLFLYVTDFGASGEVVTQTHSQAVADDCCDAESEDGACGGSGGDAAEDDDEGVDAAVEAAVDQGLQVLSGLDVAFLMGLLASFGN
jgi:hypothetical protein